MSENAPELTDNELHALIGEAMVAFGQLEHDLRCSTAEAVCPALGYPLNVALLARVRFSELVEMYDFIVSYSIQRAQDAGRLRADERARIEDIQRSLRTELNNVNERRNKVVHSAFIEVEHVNANTTTPTEITLEALKPFLNRRALEPSEDFNPFVDIRTDVTALIEDVKRVSGDFNTFDQHVLPYRYLVWEPFCAWLTNRDSQASGV